jgi:DNA-binding NarL/FixJ family response regulator
MRILLADDQPKVRFALRVLLERQPGLKVVGEISDTDDLLAQTEADCPDVVLLSWGLPGLTKRDPSASRRSEPAARNEPGRSEPSAQGLLSALHRVCPGLRVIVLSGRPEARRAALAAGADAFVYKCDPPERLLAAIADCSARGKAGSDASADKEVE